MLLTPSSDLKGPYKAFGNSDEWGEKYASILQGILNSDFSVITEDYDIACLLYPPEVYDAYSRSEADIF
tara:strand:+ start:149 stop:355 length:207 start_codon:yes stop_codon:yes gene_type:complete